MRVVLEDLLIAYPLGDVIYLKGIDVLVELLVPVAHNNN